MNTSKTMNVFSVVPIISLIFTNLLNLFWTIHLTIEQFNTGFGYGTNMDIGVFYPWIIEIICLPALIIAIIYFIISFFKKTKKSLLITNICLFTVAVLQYVITNLFIWY